MSTNYFFPGDGGDVNGLLNDSDEHSGSLLREIDNQLKCNHAAVAVSTTALSDETPYDTATSENSDSANATSDEGLPPSAVCRGDEFPDDNAFFEATELDSSSISVSESCIKHVLGDLCQQQQQQPAACVAVHDACCQTTLPRNAKLCLIADDGEADFA